MAILLLLGEYSERKVSVYNILAGAALLILLWEPRELFQVGFQFSFLGVSALVYGPAKLDQLLPLRGWLLDKFPDRIWVKYLLKWIWNPFRISLAAVLINLPLTIYYYGAIPTYAVIANLLVVPLVGLIVFLGIFLLLTASFSHWLAAGIGALINCFEQFLNQGVTILSDFPASYIEVSFPRFWQAGLWTIAVFLLLNAGNSRARRSLLAVILLQVFSLVYRPEPAGSQLQVTFLDVGQGDAACLVFPNKQAMLIDAGDKFEKWDSGLNTILPFLKKEGLMQLRYFVISHPHDDHIAGFYSLLSKVGVDTLIISNYMYNSQIYRQILSSCQRYDIYIRRVQKGECLYPDPCSRVYILHPDSSYTSSLGQDGSTCNNSSLVLKIQYGQNGILFCGDLQSEAEKSILSYGDFLECELLKVAHHGAANASSLDLLRQVQPLCGIVSVAEKNKFRHPSVQTLQRFSAQGIPLYRTSNDGAVMFEIGLYKIKKINWRSR
jgi:competence protein ComEC